MQQEKELKEEAMHRRQAQDKAMLDTARSTLSVAERAAEKAQAQLAIGESGMAQRRAKVHILARCSHTAIAHRPQTASRPPAPATPLWTRAGCGVRRRAGAD